MSVNKNSTYHRLIISAAECFSEKGFNATSVNEIARRAKVSQGAMYTYFRGKSELISAIVEEEKNTALDNYNKPFEGQPFQRVSQLVRSCINEVGYPANHRLWVEIIAEASRNEDVRQTFISTDEIMRDGIKSIILQGIGSGDFPASLDANQATIAIYALIDGLISRKAINPDFSLDNDLPQMDSLLHFILSNAQ
ncbi:TetR/AcrR family transcriptional regulator [Klebsiella pneumoniae]|uniref:TetR/AcrR family transcriptional regulator n=1 Tax=Klebsiella pneumoniae TaxID=573 RepID=UPI00036B8451|nr:TetR/AcrR family transcriptional regulator [Klebsiella pneumoniae]MBD8395871.1 TetR/AcrR family transcriptional regulator [Klebsiella pneumoniae]